MKGSNEFGKEENLLFLISLLIQQYGQPFENCVPECREEIEKACAFMEQRYAERIYLDFLCILEDVLVNTRSQSNKSVEIIGEMALIGEAGLQRRLNGGNALFQKLFGLADAGNCPDFPKT